MGVIIRQGFKASLSSFIGILIGFVGLIYLQPKFFTPKELGAVRLFIELGTVLSAFSLLGTHYSINRFFPFFKTADHKHHGFFFWAFLFPAIGYLLLLFFIFISNGEIFTFINKSAPEYSELLPWLLLLIFLILFQIVTEVSCANFGRTAVPNFFKEVVIRSLILLAGFLFYMRWINFEQCISLIVLSYLIAVLGNLLFLSRLTRISLKPDFNFIKNNPGLRKDVLKFTLLLFFSGIAALIAPKLDFFLISKIRDELSEVAIYAIGFNLAALIEVPKRTVMQISTPIIASHMRNGNILEVESLNKRNGTNQLLLSGIILLLIWINIDNLYSIMPRGEIYAKGKYVVLFIGISKLIDALLSGNSPILTNSKYYSYSTISILISIITSVGFNYVLILNFGLIGGAISTILVMLFVNGTNMIIVQSKLKINPFDKSQFYILAILCFFYLTSLSGSWFDNPYIDGFIRTPIYGLIMVFIFYRLKLSEEFNQLIQGLLQRVGLAK